MSNTARLIFILEQIMASTIIYIQEELDDPVELYCTQDEDTKEWHVWFPHPMGGMNVLETFDNESDARVCWQQQMDSADFGDQE